MPSSSGTVEYDEQGMQNCCVQVMTTSFVLPGLKLL
jgi:hypothetical protein